jgi:hypothetical protein
MYAVEMIGMSNIVTAKPTMTKNEKYKKNAVCDASGLLESFSRNPLSRSPNRLDISSLPCTLFPCSL